MCSDRIVVFQKPCPSLADAVEKGENEPIKIFACTAVETRFP